MTMASAGAIQGKYLPNGSVQWHLGVALHLPYWGMRSALYRLIRMAIEMACKAGPFFLLSILCLA